MPLPRCRIPILSTVCLLGVAGCNASVPTRSAEMPSLVRAGSLTTPSTDPGFARNDPGLGRDRNPLVRTDVRSAEIAYDRQQIVNGVPYSDYRVTTRTRGSLRH